MLDSVVYPVLARLPYTRGLMRERDWFRKEVETLRTRLISAERDLEELRTFSDSLPKLSYHPDLVPPLELMRREQSEVMEEWYRWADDWAMALRIYGRVRRSSRVLEIGCGLGRIAFPLRLVLLEGYYDGFDICDYKIAFLQRNFHRLFANFRFIHADVRNTVYNSSGTIDARDFVFPYPDGAFDTVFAASVFTHMLPAGCRNYFQQAARVLRPEGRAVFSCFLLDDYDPKRPRPFDFAMKYFDFNNHPHEKMGRQFAVANLQNPEETTAYHSQILREFANGAGLITEEVLPGMWTGLEGPWVGAQDIMVFRRATTQNLAVLQ